VDAAGSSSPLRRSGMGVITVCSRFRLCATPCSLRGGKPSASAQVAYKETFVNCSYSTLPTTKLTTTETDGDVQLLLLSSVVLTTLRPKICRDLSRDLRLVCLTEIKPPPHLSNLPFTNKRKKQKKKQKHPLLNRTSANNKQPKKNIVSVRCCSHNDRHKLRRKIDSAYVQHSMQISGKIR
jgi:hypothetical protein